jgi:hypothetical protein
MLRLCARGLLRLLAHLLLLFAASVICASDLLPAHVVTAQKGI